MIRDKDYIIDPISFFWCLRKRNTINVNRIGVIYRIRYPSERRLTKMSKGIRGFSWCARYRSLYTWPLVSVLRSKVCKPYNVLSVMHVHVYVRLVWCKAT